jgi:hypothetical protein
VHLGCTGQHQREEDGRIHGPLPQYPESATGAGGGSAANHAA